MSLFWPVMTLKRNKCLITTQLCQSILNNRFSRFILIAKLKSLFMFSYFHAYLFTSNCLWFQWKLGLSLRKKMFFSEIMTFWLWYGKVKIRQRSEKFSMGSPMKTFQPPSPLWPGAPAGPCPPVCWLEAGEPCREAECRSSPSCIPQRNRPQKAPCPQRESTDIWHAHQV